MYTPTEDEKLKALQTRKKALEKFYKAITRKDNPLYLSMMAFLTGEVNVCPPSDPQHNDSLKFKEIIFALLGPYPDWDFMDKRILTFISQDSFIHEGHFFNYLEEGFYEGLLKWLQKTSAENPSVKFEELLDELKKYNIEKGFVLSRCIVKDSTLLPNGQPTSLGKYVLENFIKDPEFFINKSLNRQALVELMLKHAKKDFEPYLSRFYIITYSDGTKHLPFGVYEVLCKYDSEKYTEILKNTLNDLDAKCYGCKIDAARLLMENRAEKYGADAFSLVGETMEYLSNKKNEKPDYKLRWSLGKLSNDGIPELIDWTCKHFGKSAIPLLHNYVKNTKHLDLDVVKITLNHFGSAALDIVGEAFKVNLEGNLNGQIRYYNSLFDALSNIDYNPYHEEVWKLLESNSPEIKLLACNEIKKFGPNHVIPRAKTLLNHENATKREMGIRLLLSFEEVWSELMVVMDKEKNEDLRNLLVRKFYSKPTQITLEEAKRRIASANERGKLSRKPAKWIDISKFPTLKWSNGVELEDKELLYLFYRQKSWDDISPDPEARDIYPLIDKKSAKGLSSTLLKLIKENGGIMAKNRFALSIMGIFGEDSVVGLLEEEAITGTNSNACQVLGLMETIGAARALDNIANYFTVKYPNIREAAQIAFKQIADNKGMLTQELRDAIVPDFGFDGLTKEIKDGDDLYKICIDKSLDLIFEDAEGKCTKSIAKMATSETLGHIATLKKDIKKALEQSTINLEQKLCNQNIWPVEEWKKRFLQNPLSFALAQNFVWGTYQNGELTKSFMPDERGELQTMEGETFKPEQEALIKLVHPLSLDSQEKDKWSAILQEKGITPPFPQIDRRVFVLDKEKSDTKFDFSHEKRSVSDTDFKYRTADLGWRRGSILDGGDISSYKKSIPAHNLEAFIMLKGINVQGSFGEKAKIEKLFFVPLDTVYTGTDTINEPRTENDHRLIPFGEVPPVVYSEVVRDIESILEQ
ncbi:DUF4132 domain-containing protein [Muricauda brasiliensis]|uniref:DUF4132 domain-containing protein n=1 Tax=Muricauda brasiliensis TaxID=2162892 RepID=UPI000D3B1203|nr:DUF4132 domain-containing protein [Muricauda brasiliensis]